jgi:hypothetical protein
VWRWTAGKTVPGRTRSDPAVFWEFLVAINARRLPFLGLVPFTKAEKGRIRTTCQDCGRVRWRYPSELRKPERKVHFDGKGNAIGRCSRCSAKHALKSDKRKRGFWGRKGDSRKAQILNERGLRQGAPHARRATRALIGGVPLNPAQTKRFLDNLSPAMALRLRLGVMGAAGIAGVAGSIAGMTKNGDGSSTLKLPSGQTLNFPPQEAQEIQHALQQARPRSRAKQRLAAQAPRPSRAMSMLLDAIARSDPRTKVPRPSRAKPLRLCALCRLLLEDPPYELKWVRETWHPECLAAWITFSGQRGKQFSSRAEQFALPPSPPLMGRPIDQDKLRRNLTAFLRRRAHELDYPGGASLSSLAQRVGIRKPTLSVQLDRLPAVFPGDWRRVFRQLKPGALRSLQKLYQLPEQLLTRVDAGERDDLVRWLSRFRMVPSKIARITGVPEARVLRLVADGQPSRTVSGWKKSG